MSDVQRTGPAIRIAALCGSLRAVSYTRMALEVALRGAAQLGAETALIDLRDYQLPFCDGRKDQSGYPEDLFRLRRELQAAHGLILGTPVYHGSLSGVLKNAMDLMGFREFEGRMIGLVGVAGGRAGAAPALDSLRSIGRALHAWVIPDQVSIPEASASFDRDGQPRSAELERRLLELGQQVARFAYLHTSNEAQEFLKVWESAPINPGAERA